MSKAILSGVVTRSTGSWYDMTADDGSTLRCRIRGRLRLRGVRTTNPVAVGDRVTVETDASGEAAITAVEPRRNYIIRRASNLSRESHIIAANVDLALLVVTLFSPETSMEFIDRFLVTCEAYGVPVKIVLNKADLLLSRPGAAGAFREIYEGAGYEVIEASSVDGTGVGELRALLPGRTTLLSGNSGVGKSTLVSLLEPGLDIRTGEISEAHLKGRHTTTFATMYELSCGGRIIDTPGVKGFGLIEIADGELSHYFPELMSRAPGCRFYNCTHTHEPGCAVLRAVEEGEIALSRYESYLKILDEDEKYRK